MESSRFQVHPMGRSARLLRDAGTRKFNFRVWTMLGTIFCVTIYILFILFTSLSWLLVLCLVSFFSISILARLREGGAFAMWLHTYGLLANARLQDVAYVRWAWSEEKLFEMSSIVLCFFVILSAVLLMISRGKCHPEDVPVQNAWTSGLTVQFSWYRW